MSRDARIQVLMDKEEQLQAIADAWNDYKQATYNHDGASWNGLCETLDALTEEDNE